MATGRTSRKWIYTMRGMKPNASFPLSTPSAYGSLLHVKAYSHDCVYLLPDLSMVALIQIEADLHIDPDRDGLAALGVGRCELPRLYLFYGLLVEPHSRSLLHVDPHHLACCVYNNAQSHEPLIPVLPRLRRIIRIWIVCGLRRLNM